jgi:hypothetical protein
MAVPGTNRISAHAAVADPRYSFIDQALVASQDVAGLTPGFAGASRLAGGLTGVAYVGEGHR